MIVKIVLSTKRFRELEQKESKSARSREDARGPEMTRGFAVGNRFLKRIYVDLEQHTKIFKIKEIPTVTQYVSFIVNLVETYMHEILHTAYQGRNEQGIWELQCPLVERFLGIEFPSEYKDRKASDHYIKR